jgi:hypothetical protein
MLSAVLSAQKDPSEMYVGFYTIFGPKPAEFAEFANFAILSNDAHGLSGRVIPNSGRVFEFSSASLDGGALHFRTRLINGFAYQFDGRFLKSPPFAHDGRTPVLEGVLRRIRNGEVAAEAKCKFATIEPEGD